MRLSFSKETQRSRVIAAREATASTTRGLRSPRKAIAPTESMPDLNTRRKVRAVSVLVISIQKKNNFARPTSLSDHAPTLSLSLEFASKIATASVSKMC